MSLSPVGIEEGHEQPYKRTTVFNIEVKGWQTYFVGLLWFLVHNVACVKAIIDEIKTLSKRLMYLGRTPGKASRTGIEVFERMVKEGKAKRVLDRFGNETKEFWDAENKIWRNIKEADMGHVEDAVSWWNTKGIKYGSKSKEVRDWMLDSKNYEYEYFRANRSRGALSTEKYLTPLMK
ncbi:hypothetical protein ABIB40_004189 [Pedobacter sp. UYP30]|uniref:GH-E family nuclease n=1 Tax=Pedobacter sp. UYP30 TaxID=1756400 RepID=UPI00339B446A